MRMVTINREIHIVDTDDNHTICGILLREPVVIQSGEQSLSVCPDCIDKDGKFKFPIKDKE